MAGGFELLTEEQAIAILTDPQFPRTAETYALRVRAARRLVEVTTADERAAARAFNERREAGR